MFLGRVGVRIPSRTQYIVEMADGIPSRSNKFVVSYCLLGADAHQNVCLRYLSELPFVIGRIRTKHSQFQQAAGIGGY